MKPTQFKVKGSLAELFLIFIEDQKQLEKSPYKSALVEEEDRNYGDGKRAGVGEVVLLIVTIAQDLVKDLFKDFLSEKLKGGAVHSATYKLTNDKGEKLEITLNKLTLDEVKDMITQFKGNIVEIETLQ